MYEWVKVAHIVSVISWMAAMLYLPRLFVYHFDFYRLNKETEALDMGVDDYLYSGNWCFIEWSEKIASLIPEDHSTINIQLLEDGKRELQLN